MIFTAFPHLAAHDLHFPPTPFEIRRLKLKDIPVVLALGFDDMRHYRTDALAMAVLYPLAAVFVASAIVIRDFQPFVFPICAGFTLLGPLATLWFTALSRQRERGDASAANLGTSPRLRAIQRLSMLAILLFVAWNAVAGLIYAATLGQAAAECQAPFWDRVFTTPAGWMLILAGWPPALSSRFAPWRSSVSHSRWCWTAPCPRRRRFQCPSRPWCATRSSCSAGGCGGPGACSRCLAGRSRDCHRAPGSGACQLAYLSPHGGLVTLTEAD